MIKLKEFRLKNNLSQKKLSNDLKIPEQTLYGYERNIREPNIETLIKFADYFQVSLDELFGRPTSLINVAILNNTQREIIERVQVASNKELEYMLLLLKMQGGNL